MSWLAPCSITSSRVGLWRGGTVSCIGEHSEDAGEVSAVGREEVGSARETTGEGGGWEEDCNGKTSFLKKQFHDLNQHTLSEQ